MILTNKASLNQSNYKAIISSENNWPENISKEEEGHLKSLFGGEKEVQYVSSFNTSTAFVKYKDESEKMRIAGANWAANLDKEVTSVEIIGNRENIIHFIEGFLLSTYSFTKYFTDKKDKAYSLDVAIATSLSDDDVNELNNTTKAVFWARDMVNEPVSFLTAEQLSEEIVALGKNTPLSINVLEKSQIESLKMGGLMSVNKGSIDPPTFTIVEYKPKSARNKQPIVLVGKGVVYDTGGLSLKPTPNSMDIMKSDMGGAACVAGAIYLTALQELPVHVIALIPATDNRPGLNAYAPGDVVTMYNGKTVEVLNTDAEGRMILADALSYSKKFNPELVIDAATLTGAAHRAIGDKASIIMGNADSKWFNKLIEAGESSYERTVEFPFWDEYFEEMKSDIADLKNIGGPTAGMITAGKFLEQFVEAPYIHMDIAGPAWMDKKSGYKTKGGSGVGVRLLYNFLKNYN